MIDTSKLDREYMIDYLDTQTLRKRDELERMSYDNLISDYRSVFNAKNR